MEQKRLFSVIVVVLCFIVLPLLSTYSYGGGAVRGARATEAIEAQLGIRLLEPVSENMKIGSIVNGMIIEDGKLAKLGFKNIKRGDKVRLKLTGEGGKFEVMHGGRMKNFLLEDKGNIRLVK